MQLEHRLSALLQLHLHSQFNTWLQWIGQRQLQDETRNIYVLGLGASYIRELTVGVFPGGVTDNSTSDGSGNNLVPSSSKPLPDPVTTKICDAMWHHQDTLELIADSHMYCKHVDTYEVQEMVNESMYCCSMQQNCLYCDWK